MRPLRTLGLSAALLFLAPALAACDSTSPEEEDPAGEVLALKTRWDAAWAAKDAAAYASVYAEDADWVNPLGGVASGREAIRANHVMLFNGPFLGSAAVSEIRRTTPLSDTAVLVDLDVALREYRGLPPGLSPTEPGVLRTRVKWIVAKRQGTWEVVAQQMTPVLPPPPAP